MFRRTLLVISLLIALICLGACRQDAQTDTICEPGDRVEADGVTVCVYREEIIETGFDCPPAAPYQMRYGDFVVCSEDTELPSGFPDRMDEEYDAGLPQDGCVRSNQCPASQLCQAGECEPMNTTDAGRDSATADADDADDADDSDIDVPSDVVDADDTDSADDTSDSSDSNGDTRSSDTDADATSDSQTDSQDSSASACADRFESNDTPPTATPLGHGTEAGLTLCSAADEDYFALSLSAGDELRVTVDYDTRAAQGDPQLMLLDSSGTVVETGQVVSSAGSAVRTIAIPDAAPATFPIPADNTYYVEVRLFSGSQVEYDLDIVIQ